MTLPYSAPAALVLPPDDTLCRAAAHTEQQWVLTLRETEGAAIENGMFTVTEPGIYHVHYEGEYNGTHHEGILTVDAANARQGA
ncbi:MAG: hypothetical protein IJB22_08365 [Clostridia bacterium]|nr:hypothetical protein [Clostridia bacterium]